MGNDIDIKKWGLLIISVILVYWGVNNFELIILMLKVLGKALLPFILGGFLAFVLNIIMVKIERFLKKFIKHKASVVRILSIILALIFLLLIIGIVAFLLIPELIDSIQALVESIPSIVQKGEEWILNILDKYPDLHREVEKFFTENGDISNRISDILNYFINGTIGIAMKVISSVVTMFMALIFSIYMLSQKEYLQRGCKKILYAYLKKEKADSVMEVFAITNKTFASFITGQCLEACILGVILFVSLTIFRFPYALIISVLTTITALIPIFGAFIAMFVGIILIAITNPLQAVAFVIIFQVVQQIEGNFIYPKVVGKSVGLSPIWTLLAITVGGSLFGVVGMIIGIPAASIVYAYIQNDVNKRLKKKKAEA